MAETQGERLARLETRMNRVEEGVANFRDFQLTAKDFFSRADERAVVSKELDAKRARIHYWWLGLLSALIVGMAVALFTYLLDFEKRHRISQDDKPTVSQSQPQDAKIPPLHY